jgi:signal transduction histidine kinase
MAMSGEADTPVQDEAYQEHLRWQEVAVSLREIIEFLNANRSLQETLDFIAARSSRLLAADACLIFKVDRASGTVTTEAQYNLHPDLADFQHGVLYPGRSNQAVFDRQQAVAIPDVASYLQREILVHADLTPLQRAWYEQVARHYQAYLGAPLVTNQELYGGMALYYIEQRSFSPADLSLGRMLGEHAALAIENARLRREEQARRVEAERRQQVAASLHDILAVINSSRDLDKTLNFIVARASQLMRSGACCVLHRLELERQYVAIQASHGLPEAMQAIPGFPLYSSTKADNMILSGKPFFVSDFHRLRQPTDQELANLDPDVRLWRAVSDQHYRAWLAVPLIIQDAIYGSLAFYFPEPQEFDKEAIDLAMSFSNQAAVAIENALLRIRAEESAVLNERTRLARELHDAVTQTLFAASLIAEVLPRLWERDEQAGRQRLEELRQLTRGALAEMRTLLLELRPAALVDAAMGDLMKHLVEAFTGRARVPVELRLSGECPLPPEVKIVFYRVTQEALNNIAKHAEASRVTINLACQPECVTLDVTDDGRGFDPDQVAPQKLGLGIMQERAVSIGAALALDSYPGNGTRLTLSWKKDSQKP